MHPTKPGQLCRVIGGRMAYNGEGQGPNIGKQVITMFLYPDQAGMEQENVWHCKSTSTLQTYYGAGNEAAFLECWLEVIQDDPTPPAVDTKTKELDTH